MTSNHAQSVRRAVEFRDMAAVRQAVADRRGMEERDEVGATPFITAASSGQFRIAEILLEGGADLWAHDRYGLTAGHMIETVALPPGSPEGDARQRVIERMRRAGFPLPPPPEGEVLRLAAARQWPPRPVTP